MSYKDETLMCLKCGCRLIGELDHGPACYCQPPEVALGSEINERNRKRWEEAQQEKADG